MSVARKNSTKTPTPAEAPDFARLSGGRAVIDIGSNSVRLVVFDGAPRAPYSVWNEKAICGLGRTVGGKLPQEGREATLRELTRHKCLLQKYDLDTVAVFATAAVRDAIDGPEFVEQIRNEIGFDVEVLSGEDEARFAALGVTAGAPDACGLVGDLGGGSLELIGVDRGETGEGISLPIGRLRTLEAVGDDRRKAKALIEDALKGEAWLKNFKGKPLYAVGGAWRAVARVVMAQKRYPLSILHAYSFSAKDAVAECAFIAAQRDPRSLEAVPGLSRRRIDDLPYAALVMSAVLQASGASSVVISAGGVREGVMFNRLTPEQKALDPLIESARFLAGRYVPAPRAVDPLIDSLFPDDTPQQARLRRAACMLCDVVAYIHPDHRAQHAFDISMRAAMSGLDHMGRAFLGLALYRRYTGRRNESSLLRLTEKPPEDLIQRLGGRPAPEEMLQLTERPGLELFQLLIEKMGASEVERAIRLGLALRFAGAFAPKASGALAGCRFEHYGDKLRFKAPKAVEPLLSDSPRRRLSALASRFGATSEVVFE